MIKEIHLVHGGNMSTRLDLLKQEFCDKLEEFGSPERNMAERRKMLKQLRDEGKGEQEK